MLTAGRDTIPGEAGDTTTGWPWHGKHWCDKLVDHTQSECHEER